MVHAQSLEGRLETMPQVEAQNDLSNNVKRHNVPHAERRRATLVQVRNRLIVVEIVINAHREFV